MCTDDVLSPTDLPFEYKVPDVSTLSVLRFPFDTQAVVWTDVLLRHPGSDLHCSEEGTADARFRGAIGSWTSLKGHMTIWLSINADVSRRHDKAGELKEEDRIRRGTLKTHTRNGGGSPHRMRARHPLTRERRHDLGTRYMKAEPVGRSGAFGCQHVGSGDQRGHLR